MAGKGSRLPIGFAGMLGLLALIESGIADHELPTLSTNAAMSWRFGSRSASKFAEGRDVLLFGDSQVQFNLAPSIIQERSGLSTYNLALHAGPPPASYFLLKRALDAGAKPRALVVDIQPQVLGMDPAGQVRLWSELLRPDEAFELAVEARDPELFGSILVGRYLPSARTRHELRTGLSELLGGFDPVRKARFWLRPLWRNWRVNLGSNVYAKNPGYPEILGESRWLAPDNWGRDRAPVAFAKKFLDLAAAEGIEVFWLLPPNHPTVIAERDRRGLEEAYIRFVRDVQARYPNVRVLDARHRQYGREVFADLAHLDRTGVEVLSRDVGDLLARALGGEDLPRWVELPEFKPWPGEHPIEDIGQSRVALRITP